MEKRVYRVGNICFAVCLERPWEFMSLSQPVVERIEAARRGEVPEVEPVRAGDDVPARTLVKSRDELPLERTRQTLDFSQYEPFRADSGDPVFTLSVMPDSPAKLLEDKSAWQLLTTVEDSPSRFLIYKAGESTVYEFEASPGKIVDYLLISPDATKGEFYSNADQTSYGTLLYLNTALMVMYTYNSARFHALLMHSSVVLHNGLANMFLGVSGTGKSTHSRLWLNCIEGAELLNDDNPVVRMEDGVLYVYGTPWSGKTPCYRNVKSRVRAIVSLKQAPHNRITGLQGLGAYAEFLPSASSILWDDEIVSAISDTVSDVAMSIPVFRMECLPDEDAAKVCCSALESIQS